MRRLLLLTILLLSLPANPAVQAEVSDPLNPFERELDLQSGGTDESKSPAELIREAKTLLEDERLLDARTKLLRALQKDPSQYQAHILLAHYYMAHVGHFRLALKYIKQAQALFEEQHGTSPYEDPDNRMTHAELLYLQAQTRLNLDDYPGALEVLERFNSYDYFGLWYPGSKAWVLMKLGRLDEAIKVARMGVLMGAEPGRTLNMLGILFSMTGERVSAVQVFQEAVQYEIALDKLGQPATPLNNMGEVYREIFMENKAEEAWLKATSLPDGCEHVLPALNLALLYIDQLKFRNAKKAIDDFESCVAQYPLRNGEEHRALVHLARGRIDLHTGNIDRALQHLEAALAQRQWFGKIGTSMDDLQAGTMSALAEALEQKVNFLRLRSYGGLWERLAALKQAVYCRARSWWLRRRARQILTENLNGLEDLYIHNTDSLVEYPTFGKVLSGFPRRALERRIKLARARDDRPSAAVYYQAYEAESRLRSWGARSAYGTIAEILPRLRPIYDDLLKLHLVLTHLRSLRPGSESYAAAAATAFAMAPAALRGQGYRLPVNYKGGDEVFAAALKKGPFLPDNSARRPCSLEYSGGSDGYNLNFSCSPSPVANIKVRGNDLREMINKLAEAAFVVDLGR